jgi:acyl-CoA thioesterase
MESDADLAHVLRVLDLEPADGGFVATNLDEGGGVVFGGQILAQTVVAAARTQPEKEVKSLHTIFARSARGDEGLQLDVEELHGGRAFGSVTVTVRQGDRICARSLVLLHAADPDLIRHQAEAPKIEAAETLPERGQTPWWSIRYDPDVDISDPDAIGPATLDVWTRFPGAPDDPVTSQALLAYASDGFLIATAMRPHPGVGQSLAHRTISTTVLTQTISFHEPFSAADWLLLAHESPSAGRGRSYGRAHVFTADGRLVASYVQDNMVRDYPEGRAPAAGERSAH